MEKKMFGKKKAEPQTDCVHMTCGLCWLKQKECAGKCEKYIQVNRIQGWNDRNPGLNCVGTVEI
jgi:hypothetical protein